MTRPFPLHTGVAGVEAIEPLTPGMLRFTIHHESFRKPGIEQPGEILTLGWPMNGEELVLPQLGWRFPDGKPEQHWRNFTVRRFDPGRATIDVDVFLHGDLGRASAWARRAEVGDPVGFAGPRTHWEPDPEARWTLLVADETGLPALLAILETLPPGHRAIALAEVASDEERQPVDSPAHVELRWISRGGRPAGTTTVLADALRRLRLPLERGQGWGGGEALAMRDIRRHLVANCPAVTGSLKIMGYWKHRATPEDVYEDEDG
jgi:NADPH-dependent ferric siderophore reductase